MAALRHPVSPESQRPAPAGAGGELPTAPQKPEKADPNKPLKNARAGQLDSPPQSYFPLSGSLEAHRERTQRIIDEFLNNLTGKNALKMGKARNALTKSILVGGVGRPRVDPTFLQTQIDPGLAPEDIAEVELKSRSPGADWSSHYNRVSAQMQRGAASTYSS